MDTDNDSTIVTLKDVTRTYSEPDVMAILEAAPYFEELDGGGTGNSATTYGTSSSTGSGSSESFGFSAGVTVGVESDALIVGGGWELSVDNSFNWETANSTEVEWSVSYSNDTGENLVVVYRCPVISYYHHTEDETDSECSDLPEDFDGVTTQTAENGYLRTYLFEDGIPKTEYWYDMETGKYYTRTQTEEPSGGYTYTAEEPQPIAGETDLRTVYEGSSETFILVDEVVTAAGEGEETPSAPGGSPNGDGYQIFASDEDGAWSLSDTIWPVSDSDSLYRSADKDTPYALSSGLVVVTQEIPEKVESTTTTSHPGTQLTLSASVLANNSPVATQVEFVITNTSTGSKTTLVADQGADTVWQATAPGLYRITATAWATNSTLASSDTCYYYAGAVSASEETGTEYRLLVSQSGQQVTSIPYNAMPVTLQLQSRSAAKAEGSSDPGEWKNVDPDTGVTYKVSGEQENLTSNTYTIPGAGTYDFSAVIGTEQVASARLEVSKIPVTFSPSWEGMDETTTNAVPGSLEDFSIVAVPEDALVGGDASLLEEALAVSCGLYDESGNSTNATGVFDVSLVWKTTGEGDQQTLTEAAQAIQSRYDYTLVTESLYSFSDSVVVSFASGENGKLRGDYVEQSGTSFVLPSGSGTSVSTDYDVLFTAAPDDGYVVDQWLVNGQEANEGITEFEDGGQTLAIDLSGYKDSNTNTLHVEVTFANNSNRIYFTTDGEDGGTIAAADSSGNPLETGASVGHGADVTFTAEPESGYMVESWTVDGEVYTWPGTDEPYRESTLTLENISADRTVTVSFERAAQTTVHTGVVDVDGQPSSAATISVTNAGSEPLSPNEDGTYTVRRDTSLIFTAHLTSSDNNTVREWQSSTDGVAWTTIAGSGGQDTLTVYNPEDEHLYIRAVVATAQNFSLSWKVQMSEGEAPEEANASLTAVSNGVALTSGSHQPAYVAVDFTLTLNDAYYVVNWSGNVDSDGTTARLESLTADTEVTATIAKKPTVTIAENVPGGSVTVKATSLQGGW